MANVAAQNKKRRFSRADTIGLAIIVALVVLLLYLVEQRGQQVANIPEVAMPAAVLNDVAGSGDAAGRDLNTVPRYPASRRLLYTEQTTANGKVYSVMYQSQDSLPAVSAYYETEMPKHGWKLIAKSEQVLRMDFVRSNATSAIGVPQVSITYDTLSSGSTTIAILASEPKKQ